MSNVPPGGADLALVTPTLEQLVGLGLTRNAGQVQGVFGAADLELSNDDLAEIDRSFTET